MIDINELPSSVVCQYQRTVAYSENFLNFEIICKHGYQEICGDKKNDEDEELKEYVTSCNTFINHFASEDTLNGSKVDFGNTYNQKTKNYWRRRC